MKTPLDTTGGTIAFGFLVTLALYLIVRQLVLGS